MLLSLEVRAHLELGFSLVPLPWSVGPYALQWMLVSTISVQEAIFLTDCPTGLSRSLASGWVQFIGSVGETEEQEDGKVRTSTLSLLLRVWSVATSFYSRVSLSQFYWHLELSKSLLWGLVLCIAGYFTLASVP